jgi:hypothetical protein
MRLFRHRQPASIIDWLDSGEGQKWLNARFCQVGRHTDYSFFASFKDDVIHAGPRMFWSPGKVAWPFSDDGPPTFVEPVTDDMIARPHPYKDDLMLDEQIYFDRQGHPIDMMAWVRLHNDHDYKVVRQGEDRNTWLLVDPASAS